MSTFRKDLRNQLDEIESSGLWKHEFTITSPQNPHFTLQEEEGEYLNFCANNYLGLSDHPEIIKAAGESLAQRGFGMSSVRFICGTQDRHRELEKEISEMLGSDDTILYSSCFDANGGLFETILGKEDAIISDELNHASIIDGIRLSKAARYRYKNRDMEDLASKLQEARDAGSRHILIATDGVFSMDGTYAPLKDICRAADQFDAMVMVDDSHAVGFVGNSGAGTPEMFGVQDRVDIITGTLGKALGGASGGYTSGRKEIIELLRQRSRPYLFSNSLAPPIVAASLKALELRKRHPELRKAVWKNTEYFRKGLLDLGFHVPEAEHPIIPIMLYDEKLAVETAGKLFTEKIYAVAFSFPVVPRGKARVRVQISAAHSREDLDRALAAFAASRKEA